MQLNIFPWKLEKKIKFQLVLQLSFSNINVLQEICLWNNIYLKIDLHICTLYEDYLWKNSIFYTVWIFYWTILERFVFCLSDNWVKCQKQNSYVSLNSIVTGTALIFDLIMSNKPSNCRNKVSSCT